MIARVDLSSFDMFVCTAADVDSLGECMDALKRSGSRGEKADKTTEGESECKVVCQDE